MPRFFRFFQTQLKGLLQIRVPLPTSPMGWVTACLTFLGFGGLCYLSGAAVLFFQLPSAAFLDNAFKGAKAWYERGRPTMSSVATDVDSEDKKQGITVDRAEKTWDGFTLYTATDGSHATLIDMKGTVVHRWELPFSQVWTHPPHVPNPLPDEQIHWFRCRLDPNGDLLAIYHADGDTPYGYGLVKLDKDSKLIWAYPNNVHHDVGVDEDGTIYTLTQKIMRQSAGGRRKDGTARLLVDSLVVLSPQGHEVDSIPLLEAFHNSPFSLTLTSATSKSKGQPDLDTAMDADGAAPSTAKNQRDQSGPGKGDLLHANSVRVLPRRLATKFPLFRPGQVLISLRNLDLLAVVDCKSQAVVWACGGIWRHQHDAEFLDNGRLLLYDNLGTVNRRTRIIEYDPLTQAIPWFYANENSTSFRAFLRGAKQRLPNGNTLIVDPDNMRLFEVTDKKKVVWEFFCPSPPVSPIRHLRDRAVTGAWRYSPEEVKFLKKGVRARP